MKAVFIFLIKLVLFFLLYFPIGILLFSGVDRAEEFLGGLFVAYSVVAIIIIFVILWVVIYNWVNKVFEDGRD